MGEIQNFSTLYDHMSVRVNHLRFINSMLQKELALRMGQSTSTLNNKMRGNGKWSIEDLFALSEIFAVSVDYLVGNEPLESATPITETAPTPKSEGRSLPRLDSNQQPAG